MLKQPVNVRYPCKEFALTTTSSSFPGDSPHWCILVLWTLRNAILRKPRTPLVKTRPTAGVSKVTIIAQRNCGKEEVVTGRRCVWIAVKRIQGTTQREGFFVGIVAHFLGKENASIVQTEKCLKVCLQPRAVKSKHGLYSVKQTCEILGAGIVTRKYQKPEQCRVPLSAIARAADQPP